MLTKFSMSFMLVRVVGSLIGPTPRSLHAGSELPGRTPGGRMCLGPQTPNPAYLRRSVKGSVFPPRSGAPVKGLKCEESRQRAKP